jgi:SHS2 domain-containing protein
MGYEYLEDVATADICFKAWGRTLEELFIAAADATMNVMVADLATIEKREEREIQVESDAIDMLLFNFLQEFIFYKDAERLLLRAYEVKIEKTDGPFKLRAKTFGEELNPEKHELPVDVKAVTLHRFQVVKSERGWEATVILDI